MRNHYPLKTYDEALADTSVWEKLESGDLCALKTLFVRYYDYLFHYALRLSGDRLLAEDCVHDLFFRIWNRRERLKKIKSVKSYLWISLRRDVLREIKGSTEVELSKKIKQSTQCPRFNPEESIIDTERKSASKSTLTEALNQLPDRQREAIYLKYYNGMGYDEIEVIMDINYQTARNYVFEGVQNLKTYFKDKSAREIKYILTAQLLIFGV